MRIASSDVTLSSQHAAVATTEVRESLRMWVGQQRPDFEGRNQGRSPPSAPPGRAQADAVHFSQAALASQPTKQVAPEDAELVSPKQLSDEMQAVQAQTQRRYPDPGRQNHPVLGWFGPATRQSFAGLAAYDEDGNQWIDENDSIYQNLRIWSKDAGGRDQLVGLGERQNRLCLFATPSFRIQQENHRHDRP